MSELSVYRDLVRLQMKAQLQYRGAFLLTFISKIFGWGSGFVMIWILLYKFQHIQGWSSYEVLFLYSIDLFAYSLIASFVMGASNRLPQYVQSGEFDGILTKPLNPFFFFIFRAFSTGYYSNILMCVGVMAYCIHKLGIPFGFSQLLFLIVTLIGGALIQGAGFLCSVIPVFWMVKNDSLRGLLLFDLKSFTRYPVSIYNKFVQVFLTVVVPYAFINYYPAQYFLQKDDFLMFHPVFQFLTPVVGIVLFVLTYLFWKFGINRYEGTGS